MEKFERIYRHGDVLIFKLEEAPASGIVKTVSHLVLETGEVTGHAHRLKGQVEILTENPLSKELVFRVVDKAVLSHEEHDHIVLGAGIYLKASQAEYNPFTNLIGWVRD
ncbi:MAG TPA: hypothetical protein VIN08_02620 [Ohtaekwangia sp.]|uniref:hypothetical protein n=1 Tax=Ohtaekwangia sp. TaxID=2066019 RepID=UPI002F95B551